MDPDARATTGITDALFRLSVGLENSDDLVHDLTSALDALDVTQTTHLCDRGDLCTWRLLTDLTAFGLLLTLTDFSDSFGAGRGDGLGLRRFHFE